MRNTIKIYSCIVLQLLCTTIYASMQGPSEDFTPMCASAHAQLTQGLDPDALTNLIINRDTSGIPIELWEEIILPYLGIDGGLKTINNAENIQSKELKGHTGSICSAQFNKNETLIVTASRDQTAGIWDIKTEKNLHVLRGHTHWVNYAQFSPDDKKIITASMDKTARIWDATTGTLLRTLRGHREWLRWAIFSNPGGQIASQSIDQKCIIWDASTGRALREFPCDATLIDNTLSHNYGMQITVHNGTNFRILYLPNNNPTLNQMIMLWVLDQHKNGQSLISSILKKKTDLALLEKKYALPSTLLRQVFATFSKDDQTNIANTFNIDVLESKKESCVIQ